jgi:AcrR family transcriptional regulator
MPKIVDADCQRDAIRAAARRAFAERGVRGTGLAHVAEEARMGRSSLYHYYADKESLLNDLLVEMFEQERALFRACLRRAGPPLERLESLARACAALFPEWSEFGRLILELRMEDASRFRGYFRDIRRELAAVIAEGQAVGSIAPEFDPPVLSSIVIGAVDGLLLQYFVDPRALPRPAALADALADAVTRMVRP